MTDTYPDVYGYNASVALATIVALAFVFITTLHLYQLLRTRTWYLFSFLAGGICEAVGYAARAYSANQRPGYTLAPFAIGMVLILVAPSLLAASMYMELGRIIRLTRYEQLSIIRVGWLTKVFVIGDVVSFLAQAFGASLLSQQKSGSARKGTQIIKIGLVVQTLFLGLFILAASTFHIRMKQNRNGNPVETKVPWRRHLIALYFASTLVFIRCIFRLVEYFEGQDGYLLRREWPAYVFDALIMLLVMIALAIIHPSEVGALLRGHGSYITRMIVLRDVTGQTRDTWELPTYQGYSSDLIRR